MDGLRTQFFIVQWYSDVRHQAIDRAAIGLFKILGNDKFAAVEDRNSNW
jgi:hypothetical protein